MENTTPAFVLRTIINAVNQHIDARVNLMLETRVAAIFNSIMSAERFGSVIDARLGDVIDARLKDVATNAQVMAALDSEFERKVAHIVIAHMDTHRQEDPHLTSDDIRDTVDKKLADLSDDSDFEDAVHTVVSSMSIRISADLDSN